MLDESVQDRTHERDAALTLCHAENASSARDWDAAPSGGAASAEVIDDEEQGELLSEDDGFGFAGVDQQPQIGDRSVVLWCDDGEPSSDGVGRLPSARAPHVMPEHFMGNARRDAYFFEQLGQEIEVPRAGEQDERARVGDRGHGCFAGRRAALVLRARVAQMAAGSLNVLAVLVERGGTGWHIMLGQKIDERVAGDAKRFGGLALAHATGANQLDDDGLFGGQGCGGLSVAEERGDLGRQIESELGLCHWSSSLDRIIASRGSCFMAALGSPDGRVRETRIISGDE